MSVIPQEIQLKEAADYILGLIGRLQPKIALVLGSGMGEIAELVKNPVIIPYNDIPGFPRSTVSGHSGKLVIGNFEGHDVIMMQGRTHYYEGYSMQELAFPFRVLKLLGVEFLLLSNAVGSVNPEITPGDLMLIRSQVNFTFTNPLIGPSNESTGPRFYDSNGTFDKELQKIAREVSQEMSIELKEGNYQFMTGPSYETPAEVKMSQFLGADAVGMSVFPESISAGNLGIRVLGISAISNMGAGIGQDVLTHSEVIETMAEAQKRLGRLYQGIIQKMPA